MSMSRYSHGSQADSENSDDEGNTNDVGHKKLEQWEEGKIKTQPMAMDAMTVDDETGQYIGVICTRFYSPQLKLLVCSWHRIGRDMMHAY